MTAQDYVKMVGVHTARRAVGAFKRFGGGKPPTALVGGTFSWQEVNDIRTLEGAAAGWQAVERELEAE